VHAAFYGLTINVLALVVVSALTQSANHRRDEEFLRVAGQPS
jgi:hypothetical protein